MDKVKQDFIFAIRNSVCKDGTSIPLDADWIKIWDLAKRNHLEVAVFRAMPSEQANLVKDVYFQMVRRTVNQTYQLEQIEKSLASNGIHYALQKGSILKHDYPNPELRFMSDMDIYIQTQDRKKIKEAMCSINGTLSGNDKGDEQFSFPGGVGVEFHGRLLYRKTKNGIENYPDWSMVDEKINRLTEEGYALNLIGHAVSDLSKAGPGIRYILDLWIYKNRHDPQPNWTEVWEKLKEDGIDVAARNLINLSEYLFGNAEKNDLIEEMVDYILSGGLYGDAKRGAASEIARAGGKKKAVVRHLFRNRAEYENRYPWVKNRPILLPVAFVMRGGHSIARNRGLIRNWHKNVQKVDKSETEAQRARLKRFGL